MKLTTLMRMVEGLKQDYKIGLDELALLSFIVEKLEKKEQVTIMFVLDNYPLSSPATTHARMKRLIKSQLFEIVFDIDDGRVKKFAKGARYSDLVKYLGGF